MNKHALHILRTRSVHKFQKINDISITGVQLMLTFNLVYPRLAAAQYFSEHTLHNVVRAYTPNMPVTAD